MEQAITSQTSDVCAASSLDRGLVVKHFRQIVLWPLQLMPIDNEMPVQKHCDVLLAEGFNSLWREVEDEFTGDPSQFQEVSEHTQVKELFRMTNRHLGTAQLYTEVREAIEDMSQYLDSDVLRRQGETMVRLTVVTTVGLIGMATTGFLGMNLLDEADGSLTKKAALFSLRADLHDRRNHSVLGRTVQMVVGLGQRWLL